MKTEEKQIRSEIITDHSSNYFVEAGAGAGKTRMIVDRIICQLSSGNYSPSEIVAITFTNAAAKELQGRIVRGLSEAADDAAKEKAVRNRAKKALEEIDRMCIGTIHSFCFKMLKERAFGAGLRPDLTLLDEGDILAEKDYFFRTWYARNAKELNSVLEPMGYLGKLALGEYFRNICELPDDVSVEYDKGILSTLNEASLAALIKRAVCDIGAVLQKPDCQTVVKPSKKAVVEIVLQSIQNDEGYEDALKEFSTQKKVEAIFSTAAKNKFASSMYSAQICSLACDISDKKRRFRSGVLMKYALIARDSYRKNRSTDSISNDALLQEARNLICREDSTEDHRYFADKFKCIYVDEFQDTDHVQTQMILRLASFPDNPERLRPGALFVVGDPKQSIYRFRGADPQLYFWVKNKFSEMDNCRVVSLPTNFRSCKEIIDWVNLNYKGRIDEYMDMETSDRQLDAGSVIDGLDDDLRKKVLRGVYTMGSPASSTYDAGTDKKTENYKKEAMLLSFIIRTLVDNEYYIPDSKISSGYRRIEYRDFLVLVPKFEGMDIYMDMFRLTGIPVELYGKIGLANDKIIDSFYRIYSYLASGYGDRAALERAVEAVMSQGFTRDDAIERLKGLKKELMDKDAFSLMMALLNDPRLFVPVQSLNKSKFTGEASASMKRLFQLFENIVADAPCDRQIVVERLRELKEKELEREMSLGENANVIRFMNEHKAKGLEGRIVIIAKRTRQYVMQDHFTYRDVSGEYHFYCGIKSGINCYDKDSLEAKADMEETVKEQTRLEYVTTTRAEQVLIFLDPLQNGAQFCYEDGASYKFGSDVNVRILSDVVNELRGDENTDEQSDEQSGDDDGAGTDSKQL